MPLAKRYILVTSLLILIRIQETSSITIKRGQFEKGTVLGSIWTTNSSHGTRNSSSSSSIVQLLKEGDGGRSLLDSQNWPHVRNREPTSGDLSEEPPTLFTSWKREVPSEIPDVDQHFPSDSPLDPDLESDDDLPQTGNGVTVHKCCAIGEHLHLDKNCVPLPLESSATDTQYSEADSASVGTGSVEVPNWLPTNSRVEGVDIRLKPADYIPLNWIPHRPECPFSDMILINELNFTEAGDLLLQNNNGGSLRFSSQDFCVDRIHVKDLIETDESSYSEEKFFHAIILCPCNDRPSRSNVFCVNKCCNIGDTLQVGAKFECVPDAASYDDLMVALRGATLSDVPNNPGRAFYVRESYQPSCKHGTYLVKKRFGLANTRAKFWLKKDGQIRLDELSGDIRNTEYCIDMISSNETTELRMIGCRRSLDSLKSEFHTVLYKVYYATGAIFLGLTILVHLILPELRKSLHSYNFIAHNANLFVAFLFLTFSHLTEVATLDPVICRVVGFAIQFFFLSTFFWLSVMCFDISSAFGGFIPRSNAHASIKFIKYGVFAWGMAAVTSGLTALAEYSPLLAANSSYKPNFGVQTCWFKDNKALALFFYGPIGILLVLNLIQYLTTVWRITAARRDTRVLRHSPEQQNVSASTRGEKHWLLLYGKLFCLMGGTWVFEVVSWIFKVLSNQDVPSYVWYLPDGINALRGAGIFFIFLWQRRFFQKFSLNLSGNQSFVNQATTTSANSNGCAHKKRNSPCNTRTSSIQLSNLTNSVKHKTSLPNGNRNNKTEATQ